MKLLIIFAVAVFITACSDSEDSDYKATVQTYAAPGGYPDGVAIAGNGDIYVTDVNQGEVIVYQASGDSEPDVIELDEGINPDGIAVVENEDITTIYIADTGMEDGETQGESTGAVYVYTEENGLQVLLDGADIVNPTGVAVDSSGNLYVSDQGSGDIYRVPINGMTGAAGVPESLLEDYSGVESPHGITLTENQDGSISVYATDIGENSNNVIKVKVPENSDEGTVLVEELTPDSTGGTLTGAAEEALFDTPHGISADKNGALFVTDENNNRVQVITPSGNVITIAGNGQSGDSEGNAEIAEFNRPRGVAAGKDGEVFVCDYGNGKVKKIEYNPAEIE